MEVDGAGEDVDQLAGHGVRDAGVVDGGEQRGADGAAADAQRRGQRGDFDAGIELAVRLALDHQALELGRVLEGPAHHQARQVAVVRGFRADRAAGHGQQLLAGDWVLPQVGGGDRVVDAQASQQRVDRVGLAHRVAAVEAEAMGVQGFDLRVQRQGLDMLQNLAYRQQRGIGAQGGDGEGATAAAQQQGSNGGRDLPGVVLQRPRCARHELFPSGPETLQNGIPSPRCQWFVLHRGRSSPTPACEFCWRRDGKKTGGN
jgi:hypothetical protein